MSALKEEVQRYLDGFSTQAERPNFLREARLFVRRNRTPVLISFLAFNLLSVLSTLFFQRLNTLHDSVLNKTRLADEYASEAERTNELYIESLSDSKERQRALSDALLPSVRRLKSKGIFHTPMKSIREALAIAQHSLVLNPNSENAKYQLFTLNLIQLNFHEALKYPLSENHRRSSYREFAESFPDFDYDQFKRPPLPILGNFIEEAGKIDFDQSHILERIISYDSALRLSKVGYEEIIIDFIQYLNPDNKEIDLQWLPQRAEIRLQVTDSLSLLSNKEGSGQCVLRFFDPRSLVLKGDGQFDLRNLNQLKITELDLTRCPNLIIKKPVYLPYLKTLKIDHRVQSEKRLRKWIRSNGGFSIVPDATSN